MDNVTSGDYRRYYEEMYESLLFIIMKIAYISQFAPNDRRASSGTNYKVVEQLGKMGDITWFPIRTPKIYRVFELASKVLAKICGRKIYFRHTKVRIKSDKQKNVAKLLADRRFRKMA